MSSLKPRCDDKVFRSIGGVHRSFGWSGGGGSGGRCCRAPLVPLAGTASRDIVFSKKKGEATVEVAGSSVASDVVYVSAGAPVAESGAK